MPAGEAGAGPQRRTQAREGSPLAYFRGRFGRFEMAQDNAAYDRLRRLVLSREAGPGDGLDVQGCPSG